MKERWILLKERIRLVLMWLWLNRPTARGVWHYLVTPSISPLTYFTILIILLFLDWADGS